MKKLAQVDEQKASDAEVAAALSGSMETSDPSEFVHKPAKK